MRCMETSKTTRCEVQPGVWLDNRRAVFLAGLRLLVVADLHWGYAAAHRALGNLVPMWGDEVIARTLRSLLADYAPREMIWLGDSLHAVSGRNSADRFLQEARSAGIEMTVVEGNHDRRWPAATARILQRDRYVFHHGDTTVADLPPGAVEMVGHFHPAAEMRDGAGTRLRLPALVTSSTRLILPALSPWAAGVPWNQRLQPTEFLWAVAPSRIFAVRSGRPPAENRPS